MAVYKDQSTAMVIFAKQTGDNYVESPNTINPDGTDTPFNPPNPNTPDIEGNEQKKVSKFTTVKKAVVGLGVMSALKTTASYFKNNYGDIMQDSNAQTKINEAFNLASMAVSIGVGFAVGGVVGGIASIGATSLNLTLQTVSRQRMLNRNEAQSDIMMARTQYASINGGR